MTTVDTSRTEALVERIFEATLSTLEIAAVHIGDRLGFYRSLDAQGPATPRELASATGTVERYVREWLEQQAVAGFLNVADPDAEPSDRTYGLPAAHRPLLVEENDLNYLAPLARLAIGVLAPLDDLLAAYRGGAAVPYEAYGANVREGVAELNRPQLLNLLADWFGSIPEADARLRAQPTAHVADVACGSAWSSIAIARACPGVAVDAIDVDPGSIEDARANIAAAGVADRVRAIVQDASDPQLPGRYDLITVFEASTT
jgi:SAM-dependent methyltransferase